MTLNDSGKIPENYGPCQPIMEFIAGNPETPKLIVITDRAQTAEVVKRIDAAVTIIGLDRGLKAGNSMVTGTPK
jgi:hypothetical protein